MRYIMILLIFLSACATQKKDNWYWYKEGAGQQELNQDHGQCRAQAFSGNGNLMQAVLVLDGCMQGKGWQRRSQ